MHPATQQLQAHAGAQIWACMRRRCGPATSRRVLAGGVHLLAQRQLTTTRPCCVPRPAVGCVLVTPSAPAKAGCSKADCATLRRAERCFLRREQRWRQSRQHKELSKGQNPASLSISNVASASSYNVQPHAHFQAAQPPWKPVSVARVHVRVAVVTQHARPVLQSCIHAGAWPRSSPVAVRHQAILPCARRCTQACCGFDFAPEQADGIVMPCGRALAVKSCTPWPTSMCTVEEQLPQRSRCFLPQPGAHLQSHRAICNFHDVLVSEACAWHTLHAQLPCHASV